MFQTDPVEGNQSRWCIFFRKLTKRVHFLAGPSWEMGCLSHDYVFLASIPPLHCLWLKSYGPTLRRSFGSRKAKTKGADRSRRRGSIK